MDVSFLDEKKMSSWTLVSRQSHICAEKFWKKSQMQNLASLGIQDQIDSKLAFSKHYI